MKTKRTNKKLNKKVLIIILTAVLIVVSAITYVYAFSGNILGWKKPNQNSITTDSGLIDYNPPTSEQTSAGSIIKSGTKDTPPAPTSIPGSDKKNVQVIITTTNQTSTILQIRAQVGIVENTGTCTLTLTNNSQPTIVRSAAVQALAAVSSCQGFDVSMSELSIGAWQILITYDSSLYTGSVTKDITIE